ncbi:MAG: diguanylate cyclase [Bacilli bacterium]
MKKNKINKQLIFLFSSIVLILIFSLFFLNSFNKRSIKHIENLTKNQLEELSTQTINIFNERINTSLAYIESMAKVFSQYEPLNSEASLTMLLELKEESIFDRLFVTDLNGIATYSSGKTIDLNDREYYQKALTGESGISKAVKSKLDANNVFVVYAPIYQEGTIVGMLGATYLLSNLANKIETNFFNEQGYTVIFQYDDGIQILNSGNDNLMIDQDAWETLGQLEFCEDSSLPQMRDNIEKNQSGTACYLLNKETFFTYYSRLGINDWVILSVLPSSIITQNTQVIIDWAIRLITGLTLAFTALVVVVFIYANQQTKEYRNIYQQLSFITNNSPGGLIKYRLSEGHEIVYASERFYRMLGYTQAEVIDKFKNSYDLIIADEKTQQLLNQTMENHKIYNHQYRLNTKENDSIWVSDQSTIILEHDEKYCCCLLVDITKQKQLERELEISKNRYEIVMLQTDKVVLDYEIATDTLKFITNADKMYGLPSVIEHLSTKVTNLAFLDDENKEIINHFIQTIRKGATKQFCVVKTKNTRGSFSWKRIHGSVVVNEDGSFDKAVGIIEDITIQREAQIRIEKTQAHLEGMMSYAMYSYIIDLNTDGITYKFTQDDPNLVMDKPINWYDELNDVILNKINKEDHRRLQNYFNLKKIIFDYRHEQTNKTIDFKIYQDKGHFVWARGHINVIENLEKKELLCYAYITNIEKEKKKEFYLLKQSEQDFLTKLYNRRSARRKIDEFIAKETKSIHGFYMLDLDRFKEINDSFGHNFGDEVLKDFGLILKSMFSENDIVCRLGGDEFIVLHTHAYSHNKIEAKLSSICQAIEERFVFDGIKEPMTVTIGALIVPYDGRTFDELYVKADELLYQGKSEGGNRYVLSKNK